METIDLLFHTISTYNSEIYTLVTAKNNSYNVYPTTIDYSGFTVSTILHMYSLTTSIC